ncbi:TetR family transcriptional regulator [Nocardia sp. CA-151230]|uniref:TetR/AcrR family transcriptional regulator n=1 Tax=Nocardia sp. CA-151230 TaxID=3239982 RepID=UPI003D8E0F87
MGFQRARTPEQREVRRSTILDTAAAMLDDMPVADLTLNALSRRVGLAKSNVLRYFESREEILLELLDRGFRQWLAELADELPDAIDPHSPVEERIDRLAAVLSCSLQDHTAFSDLVSAQAGVLEHNVSVDVVVRYKRSTLENLTILADRVRQVVPELGDKALTICLMGVAMVAGLYAHARPSASTVAAYDADPGLAALRIDVCTALEESLATLMTGVLHRPNGSKYRPRESK